MDLGKYAIIKAARDNKLGLLKQILKDPQVQPSICMNSATEIACIRGNLKVIKTLIRDPRTRYTKEDSPFLIEFCIKDKYLLFDLHYSKKLTYGLIYEILRGYIIKRDLRSINYILRYPESRENLHLTFYLISDVVYLYRTRHKIEFEIINVLIDFLCYYFDQNSTIFQKYVEVFFFVHHGNDLSFIKFILEKRNLIIKITKVIKNIKDHYLKDVY